MRVLLIEGDKEEEIALAKALCEIPDFHPVTIVRSAREARAALAQRPFDLILADDNLEDGSPCDLIEAFGEQRAIFIAAPGGQEAAARALQLGFHDCLIKDPQREHLKLLPWRVKSALRQLEEEQLWAEREKRHQNSRKKAEANLQVSHQALKSISQGVLIADAHRHILSANAAFETITGYSEAEILGRDCRFLQGALTDPLTVDKIRLALRNSVGFSGEILNYRKDGSIFWNDLTISPVRDEQGHWTHFVGVIRDITGRKQAQLAMSRREAQLEEAFKSTLHGMVILGLDGRFLRVNPSFCALAGWSEADLLTVGFQQLSQPEELALNLQIAQEFIAGRLEAYEIEKPSLRKDGQEIWTRLNVSMMRDADGAPLQFIAQIEDITERKRAELALQQSEDLFRTAFAHVTVGMVLTDPQGRFLQTNKAFSHITGYPAAELSSLSVRSITHPDDLPHSLERVDQLLRGLIPAFEIEKRYIRKDGSVVWVKNSVSLTRDSTGQPAKMIVLSNDVSEQRFAESEREELLISERAARSEAERASRMKNEFLSTLSHELRTPLNAILGWSELLKRSGKNPKILEEGLEVISRNTRAQTTLIEDLLDMSRIESGHLRLDLQRVELAGVITSAITAVRPAASAKGIEILASLGSEAGLVNGDPDRLQQVVWNFLTNSVKFTQPQGRVLVRLQLSENRAEISVSDNGLGIVPEFLPHVFDRFRQGDSTTTRRQGGLGIGLSLVKQLAELHGGSVRAESPGEGLGSTFAVTLPLLASDSAAAPLASGACPPDGSGSISAPQLSGITVLVIDDGLDNRDVVTRIIEAEGGKVLAAASAKEGFGLFLARKPAVILCDIGMPVHDGYEFLRWVRALPAKDGGLTPAAAFTAFARPEDRERALRAGFQLHLVKPVNPAHLLAAVSKLAQNAGHEIPA